MTRLIQVANNATTTLASGISAVATSLTVAPGDGAKFPALSGSQYFKATLVKATGEIEVVKVTAKSTDTFTIERANEVVAGASTAYAFLAGDKVECRWTGNSITDELDRLDAAALSSVANKTANYSVLAADISDLIRVDTTTGAITVTLPQISTLTDDFSVKVSKTTSDGNAVTVARAGTDTINGATTYLLTSQWQSAWLIADRSTGTWTAINSSTGSISTVVDTFAGSGTAGPFTLTSDPGSKNNLAVFVGGVYQEKGSFTLAGTSLTVGGTVSVGTSVEAIYNTPVGIGVPGDATVTTAKMDSALQTGVNDFRLTLTSGTPVTTADVTGATTLYCCPYQGNRIALYSGSRWNIRTSAQFSLAIGVLTSGRPYDVFCYDNAGVPTLELHAWTNDTTRATALVYQDGVLCKSGAVTRRYMGSFYTTSTTTTEDSAANRYLWNYYHRVRRSMVRSESTASWTYTLATLRQANGSTANQLNCMIGVAEDCVQVGVSVLSSPTNATGTFVGIGMNSTTVNVGQSGLIGSSAGAIIQNTSNYAGAPAAGRNYFAWLEGAQPSGTVTWYGSTTIVGIPVLSGLSGSVMS